MPSLPTPEECRVRLLLAGWCVTETVTGSAYYVFGTHGEHRIEVRASTRGGAWRQACQQAEALGLLGAE